ncbi:MAG: hypothetical protein EOO15_01395 [Chitinophagaceae bacterium]|nr:MAG: hypothetical protein EOO15_01395 [Chitinophagaceae bacterium]
MQLQQLAQRFGPGIEVIKSDEQAEGIDLGPLALLKGRWVGAPNMGWNVITVPAPNAFAVEVIPYREEFTFTPVVVALNRGPIDAERQQQTQTVTGLVYEQVVYSTCTTDYCAERGFSEFNADGSPNVIHAETGLFLYAQNYDGGFSIARLATVPHGNSVLALGNAQTGKPANNDFFQPVSIMPTTVDGSMFPGFDYTDSLKRQQFPGVFDQTNPNSFLRSTLGDSVIQNMTTLVMSTRNGTGGILNIPFIQSNVNANFMDAIFWIQELAGAPDTEPTLQLQYTQTINLLFPSGGTTKPQINWPHVTIGTLQKVDDKITSLKAFQS